MVILGGHRGMGVTNDSLFHHPSRQHIPNENSLHSIKQAFEHGASYVEIDVVPTRDNHIILAHNIKAEEHFFGVNAPKGYICDYDLPYLLPHKMGPYNEQSLCTLDESLSVIASQANIMPNQHSANRPNPYHDVSWWVNIELKGTQGYDNIGYGDQYYEAIASIIKASDIPPSRLLLSSFALRDIIAMSHLIPQANYGFLYNNDALIEPIYNTYHRDIAYHYIPCTVDNIAHVHNIWTKQAHPQAMLSYAHPEVTYVTSPIIQYCAHHNIGLNIWPFNENMLEYSLQQQRLALYNDIIMSCHTYKTSVTIMTDYLNIMRHYFNSTLK